MKKLKKLELIHTELKNKKLLHVRLEGGTVLESFEIIQDKINEIVQVVNQLIGREVIK